MAKIRVEKDKLAEIIDSKLKDLLDVCKSTIDTTDLEVCRYYILQALKPYTIKEKCEVM